jgi:hypothetical protein
MDLPVEYRVAINSAEHAIKTRELSEINAAPTDDDKKKLSALSWRLRRCRWTTSSVVDVSGWMTHRKTITQHETNYAPR